MVEEPEGPGSWVRRFKAREGGEPNSAKKAARYYLTSILSRKRQLRRKKEEEQDRWDLIHRADRNDMRGRLGFPDHVRRHGAQAAWKQIAASPRFQCVCFCPRLTLRKRNNTELWEEVKRALHFPPASLPFSPLPCFRGAAPSVPCSHGVSPTRTSQHTFGHLQELPIHTTRGGGGLV